MNKKIEEIEEEIDDLEKERIAYLEVNDKAGANRKAKKIENLEMQLEIFNLKKIKQELKIYKDVISNYPAIKNEIQRRLIESEDKQC